jgi:hypothetical protein
VRQKLGIAGNAAVEVPPVPLDGPAMAQEVVRPARRQ